MRLRRLMSQVPATPLTIRQRTTTSPIAPGKPWSRTRSTLYSATLHPTRPTDLQYLDATPGKRITKICKEYHNARTHSTIASATIQIAILAETKRQHLRSRHPYLDIPLSSKGEEAVPQSDEDREYKELVKKCKVSKQLNDLLIEWKDKNLDACTRCASSGYGDVQRHFTNERYKVHKYFGDEVGAYSLSWFDNL
ncbi:MAG: hypothetical protein Q9213_006689 [Squamulea squamosa]